MNLGPLRNIIGLIAQAYGTTLIGLVIGIISARGLSVSDRGTLTILLLFTQLLSRLASLGFEQIIQRDGLIYRLRSFYFTALLGSCAWGVIFILVLIKLNIHYGIALVVILTSVAVSVLRINISTLIHYSDVGGIALINISQSITQLILYLLIFKYGNVYAFFAAWVITVIGYSVFSLARSQKFEHQNTESATPRIIFEHGGKHLGVVFPEMAISFCLELPLIRSVLGAHSAGLYSISNTMTGIYYQLSLAISAVVARDSIKISKKLTYLGLAIVAILFGLVSSWLVLIIFGQRYSDAVHFIYIMLPVVWLMGVLRIEQMSTKLSTHFVLIPSLAIFALTILIGVVINKNYIVQWIALAYFIYTSMNLIPYSVYALSAARLMGGSNAKE